MEQAAYRDLHAREQTHWFCVVRREIISDVIVRQAPASRPLHILEIGSGTGGNLEMLASHGHVVGLEMSEHGRALAHARYGDRFANRAGCWPQGRDQVGPDPFDLVVMLDVLEHLPDPHGSLTAVVDVLTGDGRLIVTVPAYQWLWSDHDTSLHHQRRYTATTLTAALADAGFTLDYLSYFNALLFPAAAAARLTARATGNTRSPGQATPRPPVNQVMASVFRAERRILERARLPFGLSLVAVAHPA